MMMMNGCIKTIKICPMFLHSQKIDKTFGITYCKDIPFAWLAQGM